jgi:TonB family protein
MKYLIVIFIILFPFFSNSQIRNEIIKPKTSTIKAKKLSFDNLLGEVITFTKTKKSYPSEYLQDWYVKYIFLNSLEVLIIKKIQDIREYDKKERLDFLISKVNYHQQANGIIIDKPKIKLNISDNKIEVDSSWSESILLSINHNRQQFQMSLFYSEDENGGLIFSNKSRYLQSTLNGKSNIYTLRDVDFGYGDIHTVNRYNIIKDIINLGVWPLLDLSNIEKIGNVDINEELQIFERIKEIERKYPSKSSNTTNTQKKPNKSGGTIFLPSNIKSDEEVTKPEPPPEEIKGYTSSSFVKDDSESYEQEEQIFTAVEQQAEFPGGPRAFGQYLNSNLVYPSAAKNEKIGGKVYIQFVINTDGTIQDVQILKSVGFGCDEEAIRLIKSVPRWIPGKQSGRAVRSRFTQPITFVISDNNFQEPLEKNHNNHENEISKSENGVQSEIRKINGIQISPSFVLPNIRRGLNIVENQKHIN